MQDFLFNFKKNGKDIIILLLLIICVGLLFYNTFKREENKDSFNMAYANNSVNVEEKEEKPEEENKKIFIDVKGAVKKPGVYELSNDAIINDVIKLAGGFNSDAYQNGINLSKRVSDEMVVYIYTKQEINTITTNSSKNEKKVVEEVCTTPTYTITECLRDNVSIIEVGSSNSNTSDKKDKININTGSVSDLTTLSGIGEAKAKAIIEYRNTNGNFKNIEEIMNVSGIGEKAF